MTMISTTGDSNQMICHILFESNYPNQGIARGGNVKSRNDNPTQYSGFSRALPPFISERSPRLERIYSGDL
jgi:hypothetical protein